MSLSHPLIQSLIELGMPHELRERVLMYLDIVEGTFDPPAHLLLKRAVPDIVRNATGRTVQDVMYHAFSESDHNEHIVSAARTSFLFGVSLLIGTHPLWIKDRDVVRDEMLGTLTPETQLKLLEIVEEHLCTSWKKKLTDRLPYLRPCPPEHTRHMIARDDGSSVVDTPAQCTTNHFRVMSLFYCACAIRGDKANMEILEQLVCVQVRYPIIGRMRHRSEIVLLLA